jgi:hypothetical protein
MAWSLMRMRCAASIRFWTTLVSSSAMLGLYAAGRWASGVDPWLAPYRRMFIVLMYDDGDGGALSLCR